MKFSTIQNHPWAVCALLAIALPLTGCESPSGSGDSGAVSAQDVSPEQSPSESSEVTKSATVGRDNAVPDTDAPATETLAIDGSAADESEKSDAETVATEQPSESKNESPKSGVQTTVAGKYNELSPEEAFVILRKGTEPRSLGGLTMTQDPGTYLCRQCNAVLYHSEHKFESHCGWPSFDDEVPGAVKRVPDADGQRTEIVCKNCGGHLGHVFIGEQLTEKNVRHCVNSISMKFIPKGEPVPEKIVADD